MRQSLDINLLSRSRGLPDEEEEEEAGGSVPVPGQGHCFVTRHRVEIAQNTPAHEHKLRRRRVVRWCRSIYHFQFQRVCSRKYISEHSSYCSDKRMNDALHSFLDLRRLNLFRFLNLLSIFNLLSLLTRQTRREMQRKRCPS